MRLSFAEIEERLRAQFPAEALLGSQPQAAQPVLRIAPEFLVAVSQYLLTQPELWMDQLACLTGIDNGPQAASMEVLYHLYSIPHGHGLVLKVELPRPTLPTLPEVPSLGSVWKTALFHEREAYDLLGIRFTGHPDLRRILLPADWEGYPLRKDYQGPTHYHGLQVAY